MRLLVITDLDLVLWRHLLNSGFGSLVEGDRVQPRVTVLRLRLVLPLLLFS